MDTQLYNTHSFRIGAATVARNAGMSIVDIKSLGRWKSDAYQHYIRTSPKELASLSKQLVQLPNIKKTNIKLTLILALKHILITQYIILYALST